MKLLWRVLVLIVLLVVPATIVRSAAPSMIVGASSECETTNAGCVPFPSQVLLLCEGSGSNQDCPQYFAPYWPDTTGQIFYGMTNRTNPPRCVKSMNGGGAWGLCDAGTVSPFPAAIVRNNPGMSVASDGSLIAAGTITGTNCLIQRSTNGGASWTTVFTDNTVNDFCTIGLGAPTPNGVHCSPQGGRCYVWGITATSFTNRVYYSGDNGLTWIKGPGMTMVTGDDNTSFAVGVDGETGSASKYNMIVNTANWDFAYTTGAAWTVTGVLPLLPSGGTTVRCPGTMIYNGQQAVLCGPDNVTTTTYHLFTHSAGSVFLAANVIPQNGLTNAQSPDFMAVGFNNSTAYIIGKNGAGTQIQINITRDNFSTMPLLGVVTPTTALIGGCCRGDIYSYNGKIYFTSGASGSNAFLGVIQ